MLKTTMKRELYRRHRCKLIKKEDIEPLSNYNILDLAEKLKIPHFEGVFMRDTLLKKKKTKSPTQRECWILNHASSNTIGTHWTALAKIDNTAYYFDSFGKLPPPLEVINYLGDDIHLYYNVKKYQNYGSAICGHLCLRFLHDFWHQQKNEYKKSIRRRKRIS